MGIELKKVFEQYGIKYEQILSNIYPAKGSTGFPERNLSVNFANSYEHICKKNHMEALTWYEFQFGNQNNLHIDAVIVNKSQKEMLVIEAKRFSNPNVKIREVGEDIDRIYDFLKELQTDKERVGILDGIDHIYGIILADVWTETKPKCQILESFRKGQFLEDYKEQLQIDNHPVVPNYYTTDISILPSYHLVSISWKMMI